MKSVSLSKTAEELHISRITVSKVINNHPGVSNEMKKKVIGKLYESGYSKLTDDQLRVIDRDKKKNDKCIAVVTIAPEFSDFWVKIIKSISKSLALEGYEFIYSILRKDKNNNYMIPKIISSDNISGIIVINIYDNDVINLLESTGIPAVYLDTTPEKFDSGLNGDLVLFGDSPAIYKITENMINSGIQKIGFIGDITYSKTISDRYRGFRKAMEKHNVYINPAYTFTKNDEGHFYYKSEIKDLVDSLSETGYPEAFVCANDFLAFRLIEELKERGVSVPKNIAVSGFDNLREHITGASSLTTVNIDTDILGARLVNQIIMRTQNRDYPDETISLKPEVLFRESTKK